MVRFWPRKTHAVELRTLARGPSMLYASDGRDILFNDPAGWEVQQPWLWFTDPPNGAPRVWGNPPPGAGDGVGLSGIPGVSRATSLIVDTIAGLPWEVVRGWETLPRPAWIDDPQALRLDGRIHSPLSADVRLSAVEFYAQWITAALWLGDGYIYCPVRAVDGTPVPPLWQLHPSLVEIDGYEDGYGRYVVNGEYVDPNAIIHLRGPGPYWNGHGRGVFHRNGLDLALAAIVRQYAMGQYTSGIPYGYIKSTAPRLDEPTAQDLKNKWMLQHGGAPRSIAVLNATTEFVPLSVSPLDAQLSDAREWSLRDIALSFGIPAYMLGVSGDNSTYANVESRAIEFRQHSLLPWIRRIESTLDAQFPRGTNLQIKTAGLERADTATRYAAYKTALDAGIMTRDEVRALENLPPLGSAADQSLPTNTPPPQGAANS
jgi:HK97 family phage portal protein